MINISSLFLNNIKKGNLINKNVGIYRFTKFNLNINLNRLYGKPKMNTEQEISKQIFYFRH